MNFLSRLHDGTHRGMVIMAGVSVRFGEGEEWNRCNLDVIRRWTMQCQGHVTCRMSMKSAGAHCNWPA